MSPFDGLKSFLFFPVAAALKPTQVLFDAFDFEGSLECMKAFIIDKDNYLLWVFHIF